MITDDEITVNKHELNTLIEENKILKKEIEKKDRIIELYYAVVELNE